MYSNTVYNKNLYIYNVNPGRLGDQIACFAKALWISHKYNLDLYYTPFKDAHNFMLSKIYKKKPSYIFNQRKPIHIKNHTDIKKHENQDGIIFKGSFYTKAPSIRNTYEYPTFKKILQKALKSSTKKYHIPYKSNTVGVHIRRGSGPDKVFKYDDVTDTLHRNLFHKQSKYLDVQYPGKFTPVNYFIDQIIRMHDILKDQNPTFLIYTDDRNPQKLMSYIRQKINNPNIIIKNDSKDPLHDLFSLSACQDLIRGQSHFAYATEAIGNHDIIISPAKHIQTPSTFKITKVDIRHNKKT
jgi:hypothetical protein